MRFFVSDVSLCEIAGKGTKEQRIGYVSLLLQAGVDRVEFPSSLWPELRAAVSPEKAVLRIHTPEEREMERRAGAEAFIVSAADFASAFAGSYPDTLVELAVPDIESALALTSFTGRCGGFRARGLAGVMESDYAAAFARLKHSVSSFDASDAQALATAAELEWLMAGGGAVAASFMGTGGHAPVEQVLAALCVTAGASYDLTHLPKIADLFTQMTGRAVPSHAPVIGHEIFSYESGIHADGIRKNPETYEPFPPENVGLKRRLVIGKHSGRSALRTKFSQLGFSLDDSALDALNVRIRAESTKRRRGFTDAELIVLLRSLRVKK